MHVTMTALDATLLWMLTRAQGTARQMDVRLTVRDRVGAAIAESAPEMIIDDERGMVQWPGSDLRDSELFVDLCADEMADLWQAIQDYRWPQVPRVIAERIRALPEWLKTMHDEARDYEAVQRLPEARRRELVDA